MHRWPLERVVLFPAVLLLAALAGPAGADPGDGSGPLRERIEHPAQFLDWMHRMRQARPARAGETHGMLYLLSGRARRDVPVTPGDLLSLRGQTPPEEETPEIVQPAPPQRYWDAAYRTLNLDMVAISKNADGETTAILKDGRTLAPGDTVSTVYRDLRYDWRVRTVLRTGILFDEVDPKDEDAP